MTGQKGAKELRPTWLENTQDVRKLQANSEERREKPGLLRVAGKGVGEGEKLLGSWAQGIDREEGFFLEVGGQ